MNAAGLVAQARAAFGWHGDVEVSPGPRGALGQIWRVEVGSARYALKESFDEPPTESAIGIELDFARRAAEADVSIPASHQDREGNYVLTTPGGTWLRCYDWVDMGPIASAEPDTPARLGALLATLHLCGPVAIVEPNGGGPPDPWYDSVPNVADWQDVSSASASWSARLDDRLTAVVDLCTAVTPIDRGGLVLCHRDLHGENVLADTAGALVVVDWDDLGPADPGRELARALFDWFVGDAGTDLDAVRLMVESYTNSGGPGRITTPADFSMLLAHRLNFLLSQCRIALDPKADRDHRDWAELEIDWSLRLLPTSRQLADVLEVALDCLRRASR